MATHGKADVDSVMARIGKSPVAAAKQTLSVIKPASKSSAPAPTPPEREPGALLKAVEQLTPEQIQCRDFGHSWRSQRAAYVPSDRCYEQVLRCTRCSSERTRLLGMNGQILGSDYNYSPGYQIHGMGRMSSGDRDLFRMAQLQHTLDQPAPSKSNKRAARSA